jgi:hypothetical protein
LLLVITNVVCLDLVAVLLARYLLVDLANACFRELFDEVNLCGIPNFEITPLPTYSFRWALMASSVTGVRAFGLRTATASGRSPHFSSLMPITAASDTPS